MPSKILDLLRNRKIFLGIRLLLLLFLPTATMIVVLPKDQGASKRDQKLQIDVAFIIHGSKNITSPPRKKFFKKALSWAKKIVKAFGEIGINKTRVGLIVYAEKPKLVLNFTDKMEKSEVISAIDDVNSPPAVGNKTYTGKALWFALKNLVNQTREEAIKKFFVFADRLPEDNAMAPALTIERKKIDLHVLDPTAAVYADWYTADYSLDFLDQVINVGPFKGQTKVVNKSVNGENLEITLPGRTSNTGSEKPESMMTATSTQNKTLNRVLSTNSKRPTKLEHAVEQETIKSSQTFFKPASSIVGVISKAKGTYEKYRPKIIFGDDASLVITENTARTGHSSIGRYSAKNDVIYKSGQFGNAIGGLKTKGLARLSVIKPEYEVGDENSVFRPKV